MTERMSAAEYRSAVSRKEPTSKYHAKRTSRCAACYAAKPKGLQCLTCGRVEDIHFDSRAEGRRFDALVREVEAGRISGLERQPKYELVVNGIKIGSYTGDFRYRRGDVLIVEDVKGATSRDYPLRKKLMHACHGIEIVEIRSRSKSPRAGSARAAKGKR